MSVASKLSLLLTASVLMAAAGTAHATTALTAFTSGDVEVLVEGAGATGGTYTDNQAAPLSIFQYQTTGTTSATNTGALVLPQTASGSNYAISGEYGSSSEGILQLSGNGEYLTVMGYGVNAAAFNADPTAYGTTTTGSTKSTALGQSGSLTGQGYIAVPRVVALIGANGSVDTSTAVYNVYNGNNPRSAYTVDGTSFYISGQGTGSDNTGGVYYVTKGSSTATAITGSDTTSNTLSQDTRVVEVYDNQLYVSVDSKEGSGSARDFIGTLGTSGSLPTSVANSDSGPTMLTGYGNTGGTGKVTITTATSNGINSAGETINLSPEDYYFANADTLYVADSGNPKNNSASTSVGDGGLQKWSLVNGSWVLDYTISAGLDLVANTAASGTTGLFGLTGEVVNGVVELYATNATIGDTDPTYLYGITDVLAATTAQAGESFTELAAAPADSTFKGVAFAPTSAAPEPSTWSLMIAGVGGVGLMLRRANGKARRRFKGALAA
ncbi:MAG: PEP-CTERM sorting domain-containing protein [Caulobacteraceae bacterium]